MLLTSTLVAPSVERVDNGVVVWMAAASQSFVMHHFRLVIACQQVSTCGGPCLVSKACRQHRVDIHRNYLIWVIQLAILEMHKPFGGTSHFFDIAPSNRCLIHFAHYDLV
jgi:hypothetical protein